MENPEGGIHFVVPKSDPEPSSSKKPMPSREKTMAERAAHMFTSSQIAQALFPLSLPNFGRFFKMEHACHVCIIDTALIYILEPTFDLIPTYLR